MTFALCSVVAAAGFALAFEGGRVLERRILGISKTMSKHSTSSFQHDDCWSRKNSVVAIVIFLTFLALEFLFLPKSMNPFFVASSSSTYTFSRASLVLSCWSGLLILGYGGIMAWMKALRNERKLFHLAKMEYERNRQQQRNDEQMEVSRHVKRAAAAGAAAVARRQQYEKAVEEMNKTSQENEDCLAMYSHPSTSLAENERAWSEQLYKAMDVEAFTVAEKAINKRWKELEEWRVQIEGMRLRNKQQEEKIKEFRETRDERIKDEFDEFEGERERLMRLAHELEALKLDVEEYKEETRVKELERIDELNAKEEALDVRDLELKLREEGVFDKFHQPMTLLVSPPTPLDEGDEVEQAKCQSEGSLESESDDTEEVEENEGKQGEVGEDHVEEDVAKSNEEHAVEAFDGNAIETLAVESELVDKLPPITEFLKADAPMVPIEEEGTQEHSIDNPITEAEVDYSAWDDIFDQISDESASGEGGSKEAVEENSNAVENQSQDEDDEIMDDSYSNHESQIERENLNEEEANEIASAGGQDFEPVGRGTVTSINEVTEGIHELAGSLESEERKELADSVEFEERKEGPIKDWTSESCVPAAENTPIADVTSEMEYIILDTEEYTEPSSTDDARTDTTESLTNSDVSDERKEAGDVVESDTTTLPAAEGAAESTIENDTMVETIEDEKAVPFLGDDSNSHDARDDITDSPMNLDERKDDDDIVERHTTVLPIAEVAVADTIERDAITETDELKTVLPFVGDDARGDTTDSLLCLDERKEVEDIVEGETTTLPVVEGPAAEAIEYESMTESIWKAIPFVGDVTQMFTQGEVHSQSNALQQQLPSSSISPTAPQDSSQAITTEATTSIYEEGDNLIIGNATGDSPVFMEVTDESEPSPANEKVALEKEDRSSKQTLFENSTADSADYKDAQNDKDFGVSFASTDSEEYEDAKDSTPIADQTSLLVESDTVEVIL